MRWKFSVISLRIAALFFVKPGVVFFKYFLYQNHSISNANRILPCGGTESINFFTAWKPHKLWMTEANYYLQSMVRLFGWLQCCLLYPPTLFWVMPPESNSKYILNASLLSSMRLSTSSTLSFRCVQQTSRGFIRPSEKEQ